MISRSKKMLLTNTYDASIMMLQGSTLDAILSGKSAVVLSNTTAITDPGVTNDSSQGYQPGSIWINTTPGQLRWWECRSNTAGAASWVFGGADYANGGTNPPNEVTQFGLGSALMAEEGNISRQVTTGVFPSGSGADYVVAVYALPGNSFDVSGRGIQITAQGSFAANLNTRRIKMIFNVPGPIAVGGIVGVGLGTIICDTGSVSTVANGSGWSMSANVFKYGIAGSNTQLGLHQQAQVGNAVSPMLPTSFMTATENATIYICITANVVTSPGDASVDFLEINALN